METKTCAFLCKFIKNSIASITWQLLVSEHVNITLNFTLKQTKTVVCHNENANENTNENTNENMVFSSIYPSP